MLLLAASNAVLLNSSVLRRFIFIPHGWWHALRPLDDVTVISGPSKLSHHYHTEEATVSLLSLAVYSFVENTEKRTFLRTAIVVPVEPVMPDQGRS